MTGILVFGGTFDPPHVAHIELANSAMSHLHCEKVLFVIASTSPFKQTTVQSSSDHRLAMLELALTDLPWAEISTIELDRGGTSYTIDTLVALQHKFGKHVQLHLLIGEDQAANFDQWHNYKEIESIANVVVLERDAYKSERFLTLPMHTSAISSSQIREQACAGQSIEKLVSPSVCAYITLHNLYR